MTYRDVLQEVCRVVRTLSKQAPCSRLYAIACTTAELPSACRCMSWKAAMWRFKSEARHGKQARPDAGALVRLPAELQSQVAVVFLSTACEFACVGCRPTGSSRWACGREMRWPSTCPSYASCLVRHVLSFCYLASTTLRTCHGASFAVLMDAATQGICE